MFGRDLRTWDRSYYRRIGVAFEAPNHYLKLSAVENLRLFAGLHGGQTETPESLLRRVGLHNRWRQTRGRVLEGHARQTHACPSAVAPPELLFLDEPTAGLDPVTARLVRHVIREVREAGATIFLTTHDMITADELCDRVAFLVDGQSRRSTVRVPSGSRGAVVLFDSRRSGRDARSHESFRLTAWLTTVNSLRLLRSGDIETMHTQETTLEDVFVQVTGRTLV